MEGFFERVIPMVRLFLPMFLFSYPIALTVRIILYQFLPELIPCCSPLREAIKLGSDLQDFLFATALATILGFAFAILCGAVGGIALGLAFGFAFSIALGVAFGIKEGITFGTVSGFAVNTTSGIVSGIALGIAFGIAGGIYQSLQDLLIVGSTSELLGSWLEGSQQR